MSLGIVMGVLYGLVGKVLRGVVEVDAVLLVAEEVAGPDISDKRRSATNFDLFHQRAKLRSQRVTLRSRVSLTYHPSY